MRARLPIRASRFSSALAPAETPITQTRPPVASAFMFSARFGAPTSSRITSKGPCSAKPLGRDRLGAERGHLRAQLLAAHRRGDARSGRPGQLDSSGADAAGPAVHEQALAGSQPRLGEDRVVGGGEHLRQAARGRPVEDRGHRHQLALVHDRQLGLSATADDRHHAIADREAPAPGPSASTSPASSSPGMSTGEPGGAG